jgi:hypothetical protein
MTKDEALKLALEALEEVNSWESATRWNGCFDEEITSLRQAIAEAEKQGPDYERGFIDGMQKQMQSSVDRAVNAMTKKWVGLTDEEIMEMLDYGQYGRVPQYARNFVDAIEAKLKEKNG